MALPRSAAARIERLCERDLDERLLRVELVRALRAAVPFEDYAWLLTDPETTVGSAPLADVRCLPELPRLIGLRYRTTVNRWTDLDGAASLAAVTDGDLAQSLVWRELLCRHDVGDMATVVFRDGSGLWGWVDLWRSRSEPAFTTEEIRFLAECAGPGDAGPASGPAAGLFAELLVGRRAAGCRRAGAVGRSRRAGARRRRRRSTSASWSPRTSAGRRSRPARSTSVRSCGPSRPASTPIRRRPASTSTVGGGSRSAPTGSAMRRTRVGTSRSPSS